MGTKVRCSRCETVFMVHPPGGDGPPPGFDGPPPGFDAPPGFDGPPPGFDAPPGFDQADPYAGQQAYGGGAGYADPAGGYDPNAYPPAPYGAGGYGDPYAGYGDGAAPDPNASYPGLEGADPNAGYPGMEGADPNAGFPAMDAGAFPEGMPPEAFGGIDDLGSPPGSPLDAPGVQVSDDFASGLASSAAYPGDAPPPRAFDSTRVEETPYSDAGGAVPDMGPEQKTQVEFAPDVSPPQSDFGESFSQEVSGFDPPPDFDAPPFEAESAPASGDAFEAASSFDPPAPNPIPDDLAHTADGSMSVLDAPSSFGSPPDSIEMG